MYQKGGTALLFITVDGGSIDVPDTDFLSVASWMVTPDGDKQDCGIPAMKNIPG